MTLNETSTVIKNPGNPGYANNLNCEWVLEAPAHFRMQIYVSYELEESQSCQYDRVNVYDGRLLANFFFLLLLLLSGRG